MNKRIKMGQRRPYAVGGQQVPYAVGVGVGLPTALWGHALSFLDTLEHLRCASVSQNMHKAASLPSSWSDTTIRIAKNRATKDTLPMPPTPVLLQWTRLAELHIHGFKHDEHRHWSGLTLFPAMKQLTTLVLEYCHVRVRDCLASKPRLERLVLYSCSYKENEEDQECWRELEHTSLTDLEFVSFSRRDVDRLGHLLAHAPPLTKLNIWFSANAVEKRSLDPICRLVATRNPHLQKLSLHAADGVGLSDSAVQSLLRACPRLDYVALEYGEFGNLSLDIVAVLASLPGLKGLHLGNCQMLRSRRWHPDMEQPAYAVARARNWNPTLRLLAKAPMLHDLELADSEETLIDKKTNFALLGDTAKRLTRLEIVARKLAPTVVHSLLRSMPSLTTLNLKHLGLVDQAFVDLAPSSIACSSSLTDLDFSNNYDMTLRGVGAIMRLFPKLKRSVVWSNFYEELSLRSHCVG